MAQPVGNASGQQPGVAGSFAPDRGGAPALPSSAGIGASQARLRATAVVRQLVRSPSTLVGLAVVVFWVLMAIFWPLVAPYDPNKANALNVPPSRTYLLGTDQYGRDVLSRVLAGSREVLTTAPLATLLGLAGGITLGLLAGYFGGWFDEIVSRIMEAIMAFPVVVLALLILAMLGSSKLNVILVIGITYMPLIGRVVRSAVLSVRDLDYVAAARLRGDKAIRIMVREILPNVTGPIIVEGTVRIGYAIFAVASLGFLGLGIPPPSPDWGVQVSDSRAFISVYPWVTLSPVVAIASLVVAINLVADGLRRSIRA
jgi:peptide/nickel transport system permease protein